MENTNWVLDPAHSEIQFKVKHMMISTVSGEFKDFTADLKTNGEDFSTMNTSFAAKVASISTKNEDRDKHLQSPDFFDAAGHPDIQFRSESVTREDEENYTVKGEMTIKGTTLPVTLKAVNSGVIKDPYGNQRTGFEITGKIKRDAFGLTWSALTEAGGMVVGNDVNLIANVEFIKQA